MTLSSVQLMEVGFNIIYLIAIWTIVILMTVKKEGHDENKVVNMFYWAFLLLAIGDTGHVGFRVIGYLSGGLEQNSTLVGLGALSTAITITIFYILFLFIWQEEFQSSRDLKFYCLVFVGILRLVIFFHPDNEWGQVVPPDDWSLIRNFPLMILGLSVAYLMFRDSSQENNVFYKQLSGLILISYLFYIPVILWVQEIPILGMLMIPKTIAYVIMAILVYRRFYTTV